MTKPLLLVAIVLLLLVGCGTSPIYENIEKPTQLVLENNLFGERQDIISEHEIHSLTDYQKQKFYEFLFDAEHSASPANQRVFDYLELVTRNFDYRGETYTASEALENSAGNCLSLAILTTALARLANVDVAYQLIDSTPVFETSSNLNRRSMHVRTMLYDPTWIEPDGYRVLSRPGIAVDYFPTEFDRFVGNIDKPDYLSMYFRNLAADALEEKELARAYWLLRRSLEITPNDPDSLNALAIVYDRSGDKAKSEEVYRFGLEHSTHQVTLLRNFGRFLRRQERHVEAKQVEAVLDRLEDTNPFDWLHAGRAAFDDGDYEGAIRFFGKSAEIAPYLHEVHFGLAKAHSRIGNLVTAKLELELALSYAYKTSARTMYQAKLAALGGK